LPDLNIEEAVLLPEGVTIVFLREKALA